MTKGGRDTKRAGGCLSRFPLGPQTKHSLKVARNKPFNNVNRCRAVASSPDVHGATESNGPCMVPREPSCDENCCLWGRGSLLSNRCQVAVTNDPECHYGMIANSTHTRPLAIRTKREHIPTLVRQSQCGHRRSGVSADTPWTSASAPAASQGKEMDRNGRLSYSPFGDP